MKALASSLLTLTLAFALAAPAGAATQTERSALRALDRAERALRGELGKRGATLALRDLSLQRKHLSGRAAVRARTLFARPTDPGGDGFIEYTVPEETPVCGDIFCIHYVASTADAPDLTDDFDADLEPGGNGIPDYVDEMLLEFEFLAIREEAPLPLGLGWPSPIPDDTAGGGIDTFDVYITEFDGALYGYANAEDPGDGSLQWPAYMVLDNDYSIDEFGYDDPTAPLQVTAAHEYNHVLQFAIDIRFDVWIGEAVATWMEDKIYPDVNDWQFYLPAWASAPETPLDDDTAANGLKIYGSSVFMHWLSDHYGDRIIRAAFEGLPTADPPIYSYSAFDIALAARGGINLGTEYAKMAAASTEWKSFGSGVHDGSEFTPEVKRTGLLFPGQTVAPVLDHTGFVVYDVQPSGNDTVKLQVTAPAGTPSALALVGRLGDIVDTRITQLPDGGNGSVTLVGADTYERVSAVVVNTDTSADGGTFDPDLGVYTWNYRKNAQPYSAKLVTDFVAPETVLVGGPTDGDVEGAQTFGLSADEPAVFECSLDGAPFAACTNPVTTPALAPGLHTFAARAIDGDGNVGFPARRDFYLYPASLPLTEDDLFPALATTGDEIKGALRRHGLKKLKKADPKFSFDAPGAGTLDVALKIGKTTIAFTKVEITRAKELTTRLRVTHKGEQKLKKVKKEATADIEVKFTPYDGGPPVSYAVEVTLRK